MDYFSKFLRPGSSYSQRIQVDRAEEFHNSWYRIKDTLLMPDERQLTKGIYSTDVPAQLQSMVDSLVWESTRLGDGSTGVCLEYLLKNDVLGTLVHLSESDRPSGIQKEVLRAVSNMVVMLDEQFLVHSVVHRAILRLLRNCVGDNLQEQLDGKSRLMGAASNAVRAQPSEHEKDLVNLLCILCSRIRTYRELLMIFFHDKHWYRSDPLFSAEDEEQDEDENEEEEDPDSTLQANKLGGYEDTTSPTLSHVTITENQLSAVDPMRKTEYEFLLFNYLLRFVHREGEIGEFARAGLLFLMDVAMSPNEANSQLQTAEISVAQIDPVNDAAVALAEYILDGDFSDVLGAGLSAVYSLLPSKLAFYPQARSQDMNNGMRIGETLIDEDDVLAMRERYLSMGIEDARSPEFKAKIDHFLTLLVFIQDALRRNKPDDGIDASLLVGTAIVQNILDAVRRIFLENVLYPSILECSDADGSAVAVMSYIEIIARTLQDGPLANLFVNFLVTEDNDDTRPRQFHGVVSFWANGPSPGETTTKHRRRQSSAMTLLEMEAPGSRKPTDYFTSMGRFTLKDLLLTNLKSKFQTTATSALQLFQTMLIYHPQVTNERILLVVSDSLATSFPHPGLIEHPSESVSNLIIPEDVEVENFRFLESRELDLKLSAGESLFVQPGTTYSTHERESSLYLSLVSRVDPLHNNDTDIFSTGYDRYLKDALLRIQGQAVYWQALEESDETRPRYKHHLNVNDPMLSTLFESMTNFFSNTPDFNIGLTGVFATLASHPDRSLAGWLTFAISEGHAAQPLQFNLDRLESDGDDRSIDFIIEEKLASETNVLPAASVDDSTRPILYTIYHGLITQLERYRDMVENFDRFLLERRQGLLFSENLTDALNLALDFNEEPRLIQPPPHRPVTKPKAKARQTPSLVSFLTPRKSKPAKSTPQPVTPPQNTLPKAVTASPFGAHYQRTGSMKVEPFAAPIPSSGPWTPTSKRRQFTAADEDVFGSAWSGKLYHDVQTNGIEVKEKLPPVTLSHLLDNIVLVEESIKELVAIIHGRRSLGIDSLRYI